MVYGSQGHRVTGNPGKSLGKSAGLVDLRDLRFPPGRRVSGQEPGTKLSFQQMDE